jgi:hypothetical protein
MRTPLPAALSLLVLAAATQPAIAHVMLGRPTLRHWVVQSDLALLVEFESDSQMWQAENGSDRQEFFRVRVLETLRGVAPGAVVEFFPHAEGFPGFRAGDRALLFLERTIDEIELAPLAPRFAWHSRQGAGQEWRLAGPEGEATLAAARRWVALREGGAGDPRPGLRAALLGQLASGVVRLRLDALAELARLRLLPGVLDAPTLAALERWAAAPALPVTHRLALVRLLEGTTGFDAAAHLRALAREPLGEREAAQLARVAARADDPALRAWLVERSHDPRPAVRREASAALRPLP